MESDTRVSCVNIFSFLLVLINRFLVKYKKLNPCTQRTSMKLTISNSVRRALKEEILIAGRSKIYLKCDTYPENHRWPFLPSVFNQHEISCHPVNESGHNFEKKKKKRHVKELQ